MRKAQWRLSFSRAETVLLNSWSVKQQSLSLASNIHENNSTERWCQHCPEQLYHQDNNVVGM
jgi:hypothetical protein